MLPRGDSSSPLLDAKSPVALSAKALTVLRPQGVLKGEFVAMPAMRGRSALVLSTQILSLRDRLKMRRIAARRPVAQVINNEVSRDRAVCVLVGEAVSCDRAALEDSSLLIPPFDAEGAVSVSLQRSLPRPACRRPSDIDHLPKPLALRARLRASQSHRNIVPEWHRARRYV